MGSNEKLERFVVGTDGLITVPDAGQIRAQGCTTDELETTLATRLKIAVRRRTLLSLDIGS